MTLPEHKLHQWLKLTKEEHDDKAYDFSDLLYHASCGVCGYELEWEALFDADGTSHGVTCCNMSYFMRPETYTVFIDEVEPEDEEYDNEL